MLRVGGNRWAADKTKPALRSNHGATQAPFFFGKDRLVMKPLNLSSNRLAGELGVSVPRLDEFVRGRRSMSGDMALRLARYWGNTPKFWMNLQAHYDLVERARYQ